MKKILYSVFAIAMAAFTFTSCEDVPSPYDDPNDNPSDEPIVIEPSGDGTAESPYNVARVLELAGALESGEDLPSKVYITGVVVGIEENYNSLGPSGTPYGNATFTIADNEDSNTTFLVYRANYFDNKKWQEGQDILEFGDSVVVYGTVTNYNGTIETDQNNAYLVYLNGQTGEGGGGNEPVLPGDTYISETFADDLGVFTVKTLNGTPWLVDFSCLKGSGYDNTTKVTTPSESYAVSAPIDLSASQGATISFEYILRYVTNYGEPVPGVSNKVLITDSYTGDPSTTTWTDITGTLTEGRDWETWSNYSMAVPTEFIGKNNVVMAFYYLCGDDSGTWEIRNLTVREGEGGEDQPGTGGEGLATVTKDGNIVTMVDPDVTTTGSTITCDLSSYGWANAEEVTTVTLDDDTVISFSQADGTTSPKFYTLTNGVRLYALNTLTFAATKKIARIVLTCDQYNTDIYVGNPQLYTEIDGNTWTLVNDWTENNGGTQLRVQTIEITYAE